MSTIKKEVKIKANTLSLSMQQATNWQMMNTAYSPLKIKAHNMTTR